MNPQNEDKLIDVSSTGMPAVEELLLSQGDPVGPSVQRGLQAEEDLGCCWQVGVATRGKDN